MMQAHGFDNTQCNQLATDAITGMTSALKAEQDTMTALSTGADCLVVTPATRRLLGIAAQQQLLDDAAAALVLAKADLATRETALATASSAPVSITMTLDTIGTDMAAIGQAVSLDSVVVSAKAAVVTAQAVKAAANLVVVADQASFDTAVTATQDSSQECLCNAKAAHDTAWPNAQKVVTDNTQAWKEAHHVKCALDGTADDACSVPAFTVTDTVLVTEAANVVCTEAPTPAPTEAPTPAPTPALVATCDAPLANTIPVCSGQLSAAGKTDKYGPANSLGFTHQNLLRTHFLPYCQQKCATGRAGEVCSAILMPKYGVQLTCTVYYDDSVTSTSASTCGLPAHKLHVAWEMHMNCH